MPEPCGGGIGGGVGDASDLGAAVAGTGAGFSGQPGFARHQGQVGHGGGQVQPEPGFGTAEVAGLADSQLDQSRQPVLHHHPALPVLGKGLALLQGTGPAATALPAGAAGPFVPYPVLPPGTGTARGIPRRPPRRIGRPPNGKSGPFGRYAARPELSSG